MAGLACHAVHQRLTSQKSIGCNFSFELRLKGQKLIFALNFFTNNFANPSIIE